MRVYLDNNATTAVDSQVSREMKPLVEKLETQIHFRPLRVRRIRPLKLHGKVIWLDLLQKGKIRVVGPPSCATGAVLPGC